MSRVNTSSKIIRKGHLANKVVIVDGQPGCGKTMLSPIIATMDRVELLSYSFEIEFICRLFYLKKIDEDAAISMIRMLSDHKLYQTMMGREVNFRYSDLSSVFNDAKPLRYFKRIFQQGDLVIPDRINQINPILNLTMHDILGYSSPIFEALDKRVVIIEVVRHPLYMLIQQTLNFERLLDNPRDIQINIEYNKKQLPYFTYGWEKLFLSSNPVEKSIYLMKKAFEMKDKNKKSIYQKFGKQILTIPFEKFVLEPEKFIKKIERSIETKKTSLTNKVLKKQRVPRNKVSDGIPLAIYKRCGWKPPQEHLSEKEELLKRREFAIQNNASKKSIKLLDELSSDYEQNIWRPS